jgi:hypothetical protein
MTITAKLNDRVRAVWGAMFPTSEGVVIDLHPTKGALIKWDDWCEMSPSWHDIRAPYEGVGSPTGVYLD